VQLVGISLAYFMVLLDTTVLAVAEPNIMASLHTGVIGVGWATTIYTMALASALVFGGSLADRLGAYRVFMVGVIGFGAASMACALSPNLAILLMFRAILGLFAAAIIPSSLGLIASLYPEPVSRGRAISAWAAISGAAMAAGPVLGGWLIALDDWRAVFVVNAPMALVVLLLCRTQIASTPHARTISWLPHLGLAAALATLTLAITQAGQRSWILAALFGLIALGLAYGTTVIDRGSRAPLIISPLRRNPAAWTAFGWAAAINYALTTIIFSIPLLLHATAVDAGATLLPMTLLVALNPLVTGRLVAAYGPLRPIRMGFTAFPIGLCLTAFAMVDHHQPVVLSIGLLLCGLGVSWTLPALVGFAVNHAPQEATGAVGGILNATRQVGATIAAAVASATLTQHDNGRWTATPFLIAAAICLLGLCSATLWKFARTTTSSRRHVDEALPGGQDSGDRDGAS
jgi:DHA2 family methylenomycin A resistance protein-like MFS transporter